MRSPRADFRDSIFGESVPGFSEEAQMVSRRLAEAYEHWSETETYRRNSLALEFAGLAAAWKVDAEDESSPVRIAMHPAYQRIIGLGKPAVPLILADLEETQDPWFWALRAITGQDPVAPEDRGYINKMVRSWIRWGIRNNII
jgi:hypothetical protein